MVGRVAILGAGGFVGARLLEMAVHEGRTDVVPIVRAFRSAGRSAHLGVPYRLGDASRPESLAPALADCDAVVNLTIGAPSEILPNTRSIYTAAVAAGARVLVHLSSAAVYGPIERPDLPDDAPPRLDHWMPYAREKALAENFLRERMADGRLAIVVLRPSLVWGPGSPWVLGPASEIARGAAYLVGGGGGICNLMYVDDLVRSIHAAVERPTPGFYHVADDETPTWRQYYEVLAAGLGVDFAAVRFVPGEGYRPGLRDCLEQVRALPAYRWLKDRWSVETRTLIKLRLARALGRDRWKESSASGGPIVTREMWELQSTRYRLPTAKFRAAFGQRNRTSFAEGRAASLAWLRFLGFAEGLHAARPPRSAAPPLVAAG